MVLSVDVGEFRLQKQIVAPNDSFIDRARHRRTDAGFEVMPPLVRGVDAAEAGINRKASEAFGLVLFPRSAVEEAGCARAQFVRSLSCTPYAVAERL